MDQSSIVCPPVKYFYLTGSVLGLTYPMLWLEKHFGRFAVPQLTLAMIILTAVVTGADLAFELGIGRVSLGRVLQGDWWHIFFYPFRIGVGEFFGLGPWIPLFIYLYVYWLFGSQLEAMMGDFRYNLYILLGIIFTLLGSLTPYPVHAEFIYLSVFIAVAYLNPNMQILLFFVIPVKLKFIAIFIVAMVLLPPLIALLTQGLFLPLLGPALAFLNFLIFFGPQIVRGRALQPVRAARFKKAARIPETQPMHSCTVCGRTEVSNPELEFRFCVDCADHEYCMEHLHTHEHI